MVHTNKCPAEGPTDTSYGTGGRRSLKSTVTVNVPGTTGESSGVGPYLGSFLLLGSVLPPLGPPFLPCPRSPERGTRTPETRVPWKETFDPNSSKGVVLPREVDLSRCSRHTGRSCRTSSDFTSGPHLTTVDGTSIGSDRCTPVHSRGGGVLDPDLTRVKVSSGIQDPGSKGPLSGRKGRTEHIRNRT